jgi:hypothetical protein
MAWNKADKAELARLKDEVSALRAELAAVKADAASLRTDLAVFMREWGPALHGATQFARQALERMTALTADRPAAEGNPAIPPTPETIRDAYRSTCGALAACAHTDPAEQLAELCIALREQPGPTRLHALLLARAVQGGLQLGELLESEDVAATIARHANRPTRGTGTVPPSGTGEGEE